MAPAPEASEGLDGGLAGRRQTSPPACSPSPPSKPRTWGLGSLQLPSGKSEDVSNTEANPGSPGTSVVVAFKSGSSPRSLPSPTQHLPCDAPNREQSAVAPALVSCQAHCWLVAQWRRALRAGYTTGCSGLGVAEGCRLQKPSLAAGSGRIYPWPQPPAQFHSTPNQPGRQVGAGRGRGHTPRSAPGARQGAPPCRPTPRRAPGRPPRAGALPRAEDPGRASSRQACELPPSGAPGEPRLAAAAEPAAALPLLPHPRLARGILPGRVPAPPSGPYPGPPSLPPQPVSGRRSSRGVEREEPRGRDRASGAAPGSQRDVPKSNLSGGSRKRNSAGSAPATLFPPPDSLPPPSPAFLPSATRALRPSPCLCLAVPPPLASHSYLFVPYPLGTPVPLPSPLTSWTVPQAADAARGGVAWTAVPQER
ncbi:uncharacterized protein LOC144329770 [Macaca mulatta]